MNIRDKLKQLDRNKDSAPEKKSGAKTAVHKKEVDSFFTDHFSGEVVTNQYGEFFLKKEDYSLDFTHGLYELRSFPRQIQSSGPKKPRKNVFTGQMPSVSRKEIVFLDTETTGLAGGTGTVPFMVGTGFFQDNAFCVRQYLLRDFEEETALLSHLREFLDEFVVVVSFNGRCFDLPLLSTRMIMNRFSELETDYHLDLLTSARRVWSHLESCSLTSLEQKILSFTREDDLPGREVPGVYFNYLQHKKPLLLKPVFKHNKLDIVSLVTLFVHLLSVHRAENVNNLNVRELFALGRLYEKEKMLSRSIDFYEQAYSRVDSPYLRTKIEKKLTWQYKRSDHWLDAVEIWQQMASNGRGKLFPYRELAKYYEHNKKDYEQALACTRRALSYLDQKKAIIKKAGSKKDKLKHRQKRLQNKINNSRQIEM